MSTPIGGGSRGPSDNIQRLQAEGMAHAKNQKNKGWWETAGGVATGAVGAAALAFGAPAAVPIALAAGTGALIAKGVSDWRRGAKEEKGFKGGLPGAVAEQGAEHLEPPKEKRDKPAGGVRMPGIDQ